MVRATRCAFFSPFSLLTEQACANNVYQVFDSLLVPISTVLSNVVDLVVDTIALVVTLFGALGGGNFTAFLTALSHFLTDISTLLTAIVTAIFDIVLGLSCGCGLATLLGGWPPNCVNAFNCGSEDTAAKGSGQRGKRSVLDEGTAPPSFAPETVQYTYQLFAADWPASGGYEWPAGSWCAAQMMTLENKTTLNATQAETAAYCLGILVYGAQSSDLGTGQVDGCARTLSLMAAQPNMAFTAYDIGTQSHALECISRSVPSLVTSLCLHNVT
jgi:hypothetical protein